MLPLPPPALVLRSACLGGLSVAFVRVVALCPTLSSLCLHLQNLQAFDVAPGWYAVGLFVGDTVGVQVPTHQGQCVANPAPPSGKQRVGEVPKRRASALATESAGLVSGTPCTWQNHFCEPRNAQPEQLKTTFTEHSAIFAIVRTQGCQIPRDCSSTGPKHPRGHHSAQPTPLLPPLGRDWHQQHTHAPATTTTCRTTKWS
jgi:hypothetical protein